MIIKQATFIYSSADIVKLFAIDKNFRYLPIFYVFRRSNLMTWYKGIVGTP
jgi:hypothetical protein